MQRPKKPMPPLNALRAFEAAARLQSLTKASEELFVTQGAVSQQVKLLEEYLGAPLFTRKSRKLQLTDLGRSYLPVLTQAFSNMRASTQELFDTSHQPVLQIKSGTTFAQRWLVERLPKFMAKYPEYRVRLKTSVWPNGESVDGVDLEICHGYGDFSGSLVQRIIKEQWQVVASPEFMEKYPGSHQLEQLIEMPLISIMGYREGWHSWFGEQGLVELQPMTSFESDNTTMAIDMAEAGVGALLGLSGHLYEPLQSGRLIKAHEYEMEAECGHYLVLPNRPMTAKVDNFCRWMLEELEQHPCKDNLDWNLSL
ncbi:LysR substrate-binding domain-containing protein [Aliamphritea spongicola]|uniref:LysR substrate-binding domain-containing protein n=1 Tax=Aliamphritea spongicola TaxID=707589 RepID=UPI00196B8E05|nr:LysR substrate-binding domain-containing protein [Aliamphritea spongicola]MBN3564204.1 LysR family transcriptional regulator [Aliamphritea spongicola]